MKKILMVIFLAGVLFILGGCTPAPMIKLDRIPKIDNDNFATIYVARKPGFAGCGARVYLELDGKEFMWIACGMKTSFKVPAWKQMVFSYRRIANPDYEKLEPQKGKNYYYLMDCNGWSGCYFWEVTDVEYRQTEKICEEELK